MTVLFLSRFFYPHIGGVETHVLKVGEQLVKKGHTIVVVSEKSTSSGTKKTKSPKTNLKNFKIYRMPVWKETWTKKFKIWAWFWKHRSLIEKADIVHCHDVFVWYSPFKFIYINKPVYTTFHGYETIFPPSKKAIVIRKISEKLSIGNICIGEFIKKWYGTKPDHVTYGGVDKAKYIFQKAHSGTKKLKILFLGRLEKDMGIQGYLDTLRLLKNNGIDFSLEVCGDGSFRKEAQRFGTVHGFVANPEKYIVNADFVFASSYLSILLGMVHKKPVFSLYDNALKEDYLTMTPFHLWIVVKASSKELAYAFLDYIKNPKRYETRIAESYEWATQQTWEAVSKIYLKLWKKE